MTNVQVDAKPIANNSNRKQVLVNGSINGIGKPEDNGNEQSYKSEKKG